METLNKLKSIIIDNKTYIYCDIVILPAEKAENSILIFNMNRPYAEYHGNKIFTQSYLSSMGEHGAKSHHIYILSNEEIKEGDWYYQKINGLVEQIAKLTKEDIDTGLYLKYKDSLKKIIASTDKSLTIKHHPKGQEMYLLPQPSESFIKVFIEEYNKQNVITEVMVEYEETHENRKLEFVGGLKNPLYLKPEEHQWLKINPKDNTITIRKIKNSYSREEVDRLIDLFAEFHDIPVTSGRTKKWKNENL